MTNGASPRLGLVGPDQARDDAQRFGEVSARLERLLFSPWHVKARLVIGGATFFDAFDALTMAQVLPVLIPLWHLSRMESGMLIAVGYIGQLAGALGAGFLAERYGRLPVIAMSIVAFSTMGIACGLSQSLTMLFVIRGFQGLGLGGMMPTAAVYIAEVSRAEGRGRFVLLYESVFSVGLVVAGFVGSIIVPDFGWRVMFFAGGLPLIIGLWLPRMLPESPRWLLSKNRVDEALKAVSRIERESKADLGIPRPSNAPASSAAGPRLSWRDFLGPIYLKRSLTVWVIWFTSFFVTYSLGTWLPTIYHTEYGLPLHTALQLGAVGSVLQLAGGVGCALLIDQIGRRRLFTIAFIGAAISLGALWLLGPHSVAEVVICGSLACFFAGAAALGAFLYTPELYPTRARALGTAIGSAWLRLASVIGPMIVAAMIGNGIGAIFLLFSGVCLLAGAVTAIFTIETAGRRLEDIST
jgi:MFS transporter, putative metabolite:H+ symporter